MATTTKATMSMYSLKSYQKDVFVELPTNMYKTKSYHACPQQDSSNSNSPLDALEQRQNAVLERLEQLRSSVSKLKQKYNIQESIQSSTSSSSGLIPQGTCSYASSVPEVGKGILDVVISADPSQVPLSLLILCSQLCENFAVLQATYVHSSVSGTVPASLQNLLSSNGSLKRANAQIAITLVWKKVTNGPHLIVDPTQQTPIMGEVNIARYLMRLLQPGCDLSNIVKATQIDELLDLAQLQLLNGNTKERAAGVRSLNSSLGKSDWLLGGEPCMADAIVWSAIQQSGQAASPPSNVKKWLALCSKHSMFKKALSLIS